MKTKYLFKALKFACLPTLSVLILLFFGFFSISKTIDFISSDSGWAIFLRVLLVLLELALVIIMYHHYKDTDFDKQEIPNMCATEGKERYRSLGLYELFSDCNNGDKYYSYKTEENNVIVIKRIPKNN